MTRDEFNTIKTLIEEAHHVVTNQYVDETPNAERLRDGENLIDLAMELYQFIATMKNTWVEDGVYVERAKRHTDEFWEAAGMILVEPPALETIFIQTKENATSPWDECDATRHLVPKELSSVIAQSIADHLQYPVRMTYYPGNNEIKVGSLNGYYFQPAPDNWIDPTRPLNDQRIILLPKTQEKPTLRIFADCDRQGSFNELITVDTRHIVYMQTHYNDDGTKGYAFLQEGNTGKDLQTGYFLSYTDIIPN